MRPEKELLLGEILEQMGKHPNFLIMRYEGIPANAINDFRMQISRQGAAIEVTKKRILLKVLGAAGITLSLKDLPGHISLVLAGGEPLETTKTVVRFGNEIGQATVELLGGQFEGVFYRGEEMKRISELPSKNEMRAQLLSVLEAPIAQMLSVMQSLLTSVMYCLEEKRQKEQEKS